jgi:hypothetical protein
MSILGVSSNKGFMSLSPKRASNNCLTRARNLLAASTNPNIGKATREDLRRLALVMCVVAVDTYLHWAVIFRLNTVRNQAELPPSLRKLDIPFHELASLADTTVQARRQQVDSRPWVQITNAAQRRLLRMTMQSPQEVADALALIGIKKLWEQVANEMPESAVEIKDRLASIVKRRNQIVHEGDFPRQSRPRRVSLNPILRAEVLSDIDFVRRLLIAIDNVAQVTLKENI